jgi:hypothetical protein
MIVVHPGIWTLGSARPQMTDFFISYTGTNRDWAEWIAFVLEDAGYSVILQAWDFRPGTNFVLEMDRAAKATSRTILVLSPDYLQSQFASPEWAAAFGTDPQGLRRKVLPIVVHKCAPTGLLAQIVNIDISSLPEPDARAAVITGVNPDRAKPPQHPTFPGTLPRHGTKPFPGQERGTSTSAPSPHIPKIRREASDAEKKRFVRAAFDAIKGHFELGLHQLQQTHGAIEMDFQLDSPSQFTAEVFVDGNSRARCRIWLGGLAASDGIAFAQGRSFSENAYNEILSPESDADGLYLKAVLATGHFGPPFPFNLRRLSREDAAEYLWRVFVRPLES